MKSLQFDNLRPLAAVLLILVAMSVLSCSTTATIYTKDGPPYEGYIKRSDESFVYVLGCRNVQKHEGGVLREVELHCDADDKAEARKIITYSKNGRMKTVKLDICDDGTVDKRLTYRIIKPGSAVKLKKIGDKEAGMKMGLDTIKNSPCYPQPTPIPRSNIEDIDHPGNIHAIMSTPIALAGWTYFIWGIVRYFTECRHSYGCGSESGFTAILLASYVTAPATVVAVFGFHNWLKSYSAADPPDAVLAGPRTFTDGERMYFGLGAAWRW